MAIPAIRIVDPGDTIPVERRIRLIVQQLNRELLKLRTEQVTSAPQAITITPSADFIRNQAVQSATLAGTPGGASSPAVSASGPAAFAVSASWVLAQISKALTGSGITFVAAVASPYTLPAAIGSRLMLEIKNEMVGLLTVAPAGADTIDGVVGPLQLGVNAAMRFVDYGVGTWARASMFEPGVEGFTVYVKP